LCYGSGEVVDAGDRRESLLENLGVAECRWEAAFG
jgi:hypothetical protein